LTKDFNSEIVGDCFVHNIQVDFVLKQTTLILGRHPDDNSNVKHEVVFSNVVWQEFSEFSNYNILWGMEVADSFEDFSEIQKDYLERRKNYFPSGLFETLKANSTLKYYFILASAGLGGFVICNDAVLNEL
jgi:hypothetical protein